MLGNCGTCSINDFYGGISILKDSNPLPHREDWDFETDKLNHSVEELIENGVLTKARDQIFETLVKIFTKRLQKNNTEGAPCDMLLFGGRTTKAPSAWSSQGGLYSGSFAKYLRKNKIGVLTSSHFNANPSHCSVGDLSLAQYHIWSPEGSLAFSNTVNCGVSSKAPLSGKKRLAEYLKVAVNWRGFIPNYSRKTPLKEIK